MIFVPITYNTPLDENAKGLNLGEALAAYFSKLESEHGSKKEKTKQYGYVADMVTCHDAFFHQTASSENWRNGANLIPWRKH